MLSTLRTRRAVFWYLAADRIVGAVVSRGEREPLLEACAASFSRPVSGASLATGVLEVAWVLGCERIPHVAALAAAFCGVEAEEDFCAPSSVGSAMSRTPNSQVQADVHEQGRRHSPVTRICGATRDADGLRVWANEAAVGEASALFRRARLRLLALDCEACALASLSDALGTAEVETARRQPLSAVSIAPDTEGAAEMLGEDLAVPLGLAVAWFGAPRAL